MDTQAVKCPDCGMWFNRARYAQCPYCQRQKNGGAKGPHWLWSKPKPKPKHEKEPTPKKEPTPVPPKEPLPEKVTDQLGPTEDVWRGVPKGREEAPHPMPPEPDEPLKSKIEKLGPTTAKYVNTSGGDVTYPTVGWLLGVKGVYYGKSFPLKEGINTIGRAPDMDVQLLQDNSVSRSIAVKITYDSLANTFKALPGDQGQLCYISGNTLYGLTALSGFEEIKFGTTETSKYVFIPLCGDRFHWSNYPTQE